MKKTLVTLAVFATLHANAHGDHKNDHANHIGAHEHGVANLNLVIEGNEVNMMLESPAMNVMGFEYEPKTQEELERSHEALHYLQDGEWAIISEGKCTFHEGDVDWKYAEQVHAHFHGDKEGREPDEHKHDEHKHDEHKHDEHGEHSDIDVKLDFDCNAPKTIQSVSIELFERYTGFDKINVQWIVDDKQGATTLTKDSHVIHFK